jgi:hypothetical protein
MLTKKQRFSSRRIEIYLNLNISLNSAKTLTYFTETDCIKGIYIFKKRIQAYLTFTNTYGAKIICDYAFLCPKIGNSIPQQQLTLEFTKKQVTVFPGLARRSNNF